MRKKISPPPLRFTLALVVTILITAQLVLDKGFEVIFRQPARIEQYQIDAARQLIDKVQQTLSTDIVYGKLHKAEQIISVQATDPHVELLAMIDHNDEVILATRYAYKSHPAHRVIEEFDPPKHEKTKTERRVIIQKSASGEYISAYAPLLLAAEVGTLKPTRVGVLYLKYDLVRAKRNALRETLAPANWLYWIIIVILSATLIIYLMSNWITAPLGSLGQAVAKLTRGDTGVETGIRGRSEIARLGKGIDRMSREIDNAKSALKQANIDLEQKVKKRTVHLEREINYRRDAEKALNDSKRQLQIVLDTVSEGVALWDAKGRLQYANPGFKTLLSIYDNAADSFNFDDNTTQFLDSNGRSMQLEELPIAMTLRDHQSREGVVLCVEGPGSNKRWINMNVTPVTGNNNAHLAGVVSSISDITDLKNHERELEKLANFDTLTELPNRRLLRDRMQQLVEHTRRLDRTLAICYLDLDGFKRINDLQGHKAGDKLLVEVANRLNHCIRAGDTVARLGGDEFVVLLADIKDEIECETILDRILDILSQPYPISGRDESGISVSVGITLFPADDEDPDTLLRHADQAMYEAKRLGKNRYQWFDPAYEQRILAQQDTLKDLERAYSNHELVFYFQPKIDCRHGHISGAEALLRWQHPVLGLLSPAQFIPLVEDQDIALDIGNYLIREALAQADLWAKQGYPLTISVNIFPRQLQHTDFVKELSRSLSQAGGKEQLSLDLEIVESAVLEGIPNIPMIVRQCEAMGVTFSLDDFGTGYSTLDHLRRIPAQSLKIDRLFIENMLSNAEDRTLVEAIIGLGRAFGRKVIAEGVESIEQILWLRAAGCDEMQGFQFAKPMEPAAFIEWVQRFRPDPVWLKS